jgi:hypothetical protein
MESEKKESENIIDIQIEVDPTIAQGNYSNLAIGNFNREEFVLDFAYLLPQTTKGQVRNRIILSPRNAKRLMMMLQNNVATYEGQFGTITEDPQPGIQLSVN